MIVRWMLFVCFLLSPLLASSSEFPETIQEAFDVLKKSQETGEILLTLDDYQALALKSSDKERWINSLQKLTVSSWANVCQLKKQEVIATLLHQRLDGRPDELALIHVLDVDSEMAMLFPWKDLRTLASRPIQSHVFSWTGPELLFPPAIVGSQMSQAHVFKAVLEAEKSQEVVLEIFHKGAWSVRVGEAQWSESKLVSGVPDRAQISLSIPKGRTSVEFIVSGAFPIDIRMIQGELVKWGRLKGKMSSSKEIVLNSHKLPILNFIEKSPELLQRWMIRHELGSQVAPCVEPWLETQRLKADRDLSPRSRVMNLQETLDEGLKRNMNHLGSLIESTALARQQSLDIQAGHLLQRALKINQKNPEVLAEAVRLALDRKELSSVAYYLDKLKKIAPEWNSTLELELITQQEKSLGEETFLPGLPMFLLRQQALYARSLDVAEQAWNEIHLRCPWEAQAQCELAYIRFRKGEDVSLDELPISRSRDLLAKKLNKVDFLQDVFENFRPEPQLFNLVKSFPDTGSALLYDLMAVHFDLNGTLHEVIHQLVRIHGEEGVQEWGEIPLLGEPEILRVLTPDGREWIPLIIPGRSVVTLPRLVPGSLIEMRTHRRLNSQENYDSTPFYFRDPERKSELSHSLVVVEYPTNKRPEFIEHRLENLGQGSEVFLKSVSDEGDYSRQIWESRNMRPLRPWAHRQPIREELPWVRVAEALPEKISVAQWLYRSDLWTRGDEKSRQLAQKITANVFTKWERMNALVDWHRQHIRAEEFNLPGAWALQDKAGELNISLATLLKAGGFDAHIFHCRVQKRFYDPSDLIERKRGLWPGQGVVSWLDGKPQFFVPSKPWLNANEIPEQWEDQEARYWGGEEWEKLKLPEEVFPSQHLRSISLDLVEGNFEFIHERRGEALAPWEDFLWEDTLDSREETGGFEKFLGLKAQKRSWLRPSFSQLQLKVKGDIELASPEWRLPPLKTVKSWFPEGVMPAPLWIESDLVTRDKVHIKLPKKVIINNLPSEISESVPGFSITWKIRKRGDEIFMERIWRQKAGIILPKDQREILNFMHRVDLLDKKLWKLNEN